MKLLSIFVTVLAIFAIVGCGAEEPTAAPAPDEPVAVPEPAVPAPAEPEATPESIDAQIAGVDDLEGELDLGELDDLDAELSDLENI